jgi:hypothetical protein
MARSMQENCIKPGAEHHLDRLGEMELGIFCDGETTILLWVPERTRELRESRKDLAFTQRQGFALARAHFSRRSPPSRC